MHPAVLDYLRKVKERFPDQFANVRVLELGSLNINGTPRPFFTNCEYLGVDWRPGPCVDIVAFAHELDYPSESFDTIISTEMLEHDKFARQSFLNALRMLKRDGLFIFTCANQNRPPHEIESGVDGHYEGVSRRQVVAWIGTAGFKYGYEVESVGADLRGWVKRE